MVTGNISISSSAAYCSEQQWRDKTGIGVGDESAAQFILDLAEAHFLIRRSCMFMVRERIIYKRSDLKAYLPYKWIGDATMNSTVDADDILIYQLADDGLSLEEVDKSTYLDSVDAFNNSITFTSASSAITNAICVTYYSLGKPFDEVSTDELKRAVIAQITILVIERLRRKWGLKGNTGWTVPGVTVTKDLTSYKELYEEAKAELAKYVSFLRPFIGFRAKTGFGKYPFDRNMSYTDNFLNTAVRRGVH